jgi:hypothetical protein
MARQAWDWWLVTFCVLLLLSVAAKLPAMHAPLSEDESVWAKAILEQDWHGRFVSIPHPPLAMLMYVCIAGAGLPLKTVPLLFATAGVLLLFLALRRVYGSAIAFLASAAVLISPLLTVGSLQLDIDGGILLFFLAALFYNEVAAPSARRRIVMLSILSTIMLLTKYTAVVLFVPFWAKELYVARSSWRGLLEVAGAGTLSLAIAALFPLYSFLAGNDFFAITRNHGPSYLLNFSSLHIAIIFLLLQAIILFGPLMLLLLGRLWWAPRMQRKEKLPRWLAIGVIAFTLFFYLIVVTSTGRPLERYLVPLLIPVGFLVAHAFGNVNLKSVRKSASKLAWFAGLTVLFTVAFLLMDWFTRTTISFHDKIAYLHSGLLFLIPFRGSSGPFGFYISSAVIIIGMLMAVVCFAACLLWKPARRAAPIVVVALAAVLAATIVINMEALYAVATPDMSRASMLLEQPVQGQLITQRNFGLERYPDAQVFFDDALYSPSSLNITRPSTVILLDFPPYGVTPLQQKLVKECVLTQSASSRGVLIGQRFLCS